MSTEQWRSVNGFPGYQVSDQGRVRSSRTGTLRILRANPNQWGYLLVNLRRDGKPYCRTVHRLVAEAFLGTRPDGTETCHNDGDKTNNVPSNLRFDTKSANALDRVQHGTDRNARKTHCLRGHEFTAENTRITTKGGRQCLACLQLRRDDPATYYATGHRARAKRAA